MSPTNDRDDEIVHEWLRIRKQAGLAIDAQTAEVHWAYGQIMDPYGVDKNLPEERKQIGRVWFARAPESDIWVSFDDLSDAVVTALTRKIRANEKIAKLAALQRKIHLDGLADEVSASDMDAFKERLQHLNSSEMVLLFAASRLLEGGSYSITSDNPETLRQHRSLAKHMGASIDETVAANSPKTSSGRRSPKLRKDHRKPALK
jgi:hypothetical protein